MGKLTFQCASSADPSAAKGNGCAGRSEWHASLEPRHATETLIDNFRYPRRGPYYSFDYGQVHFVALDNVELGGAGEGYRGYISPAQLEWLANDLQYVDKDKLIVIGTHIPLVTHALDGAGQREQLGGNINTVNFQDLLQVLQGFDHVYHMAGHDTSNSWQVFLDHEHGWFGPYPLLTHTLAEVRGGSWAGPRDERGVRAADSKRGLRR